MPQSKTSLSDIHAMLEQKKLAAKQSKAKINMFRELRNINNATSAIAIRAIGTPFESRAKQIVQLSGAMMQDYQHDPEAMIDTLDDHGLDPLMLLIGHIVAMEF